MLTRRISVLIARPLDEVFAVSGRPNGLLRLLQPLIARNTQANLDRGFARLKELLETRPA